MGEKPRVKRRRHPEPTAAGVKLRRGLSTPPSPRYAATFDQSFDDQRAALGFSAESFENLFREVEFRICDDPWLQYSTEVPDSDGIRIVPTRQAFPDIPPLYVYYRFSAELRRVVFLGLSPAWSAGETV